MAYRLEELKNAKISERELNFSTPCAVLNRGRRLFGGGSYSSKYGTYTRNVDFLH